MTYRTCTVEECGRKHAARGLCNTHYNQIHLTNRHPVKEVPCVACGKQLRKSSGGGRKYGATCSNECRSAVTPRKARTRCEIPADHWARMYGASSALPSDHWGRFYGVSSAWPKGRAQWSPLREALFAGDHDAILAAILEDCIISANGCWEWQRSMQDGYPSFQMGTTGGSSKNLRLHRVSLEAKLRAPLGSQAAHHMCANSQCVNPDHLQPISFRENTAEMMQRTYYVQRIRELEDALRESSPSHVLLTHVSLPTDRTDVR